MDTIILYEDNTSKICDSTKIENEAYQNKNVIHISFGDQITEIGDFAFAYNKNLKNVVIPESVKVLGQDAFGYSGLERVELMSADTEMKRYTFRSNPVQTLTVHISDSAELCKVDKILQSFDKKDLREVHLIDDHSQITTIPYRYLAQRGGGIEREYKLRLLYGAVKQGVTLNYEIVRLLYKEVHNYQTQDTETLNKVLKKFENYKTVGILGCKAEYNDKDLEELTQKFKAKFHAVPRIIKEIAMCSEQFSIDVNDFVDTFSIEKTKAFMKAGVPVMEGILSELFIKDNYQEFLDKQYFATLTLCMYDALRDSNCAKVRDWILAHKDTKDELIIKLLADRKYLDIGIDDTVDAVRQKISNLSSLDEVHKIERAYSRVGFKFDECKCDIKPCTTVTGKYKCEIMSPTDTRAATIGDDTTCCQTLGDAGETAMMLGMVSPKAGFWLLTNKDTGKVLGQAECWEDATNPEILIFDNIEFADDADIRLYCAAINDWCEKCNYKTVLTGIGYNQLVKFMDFKRIDNKDSDDLAFYPVIDARTLQVLDNKDDFDDLEDCQEYLDNNTSMADLIDEYLYTDAAGQLAVLKEEGKVAEVLRQAKHRQVSR